MAQPLRIGLIGYGFMGRAHANAYHRVRNFFPERARQPVLQSICGRNKAQAEQFAEIWGAGAVLTDWRELVKRDDIDAVDICVPNHLHHDIAIAAAEAGKMVLCEKPLAVNLAEGVAMTEAVRRAGVASLVWYNYRRVPAVMLAKQIVDEGRIGQPFHYRAAFLQDWTISPDVPQGGPALWRLDVDSAGSGVTGDLMAHAIDTAIWLNGPILELSATTETFVKERSHKATGTLRPVGIDDACMVMARFTNGALGLFESTRYARGHKALKTFELNGAKGSVAFDLHSDEYLEFFEYQTPEGGHAVPAHLRGWRKIHTTESEHPYMDHWWVPGLSLGYEHSFVHTLADFLEGLETGLPAEPTFETALATQQVCDAILRSAKDRRWVAI
ncbi:MAG: Gfo/Idh/MocA family oxidoreductase [Pseudomonadota bacterium]